MSTGTEPERPGAQAGPSWREVDWRSHQRWVWVEGSPVNLVDVGHGPEPAVLLVHGLAGSWQAWLETIPELSRDRRVLALDLPGFGYSPMPSWPLSVDAYARLLGSLLDELGVEECGLVGHSMGGLIAAEAAAASPARHTRLALLAAAGISSTRTHGIVASALAQALDAAAPLLLSHGPRALRRSRLRRAIFSREIHDPDRLPTDLLLESLVHSANRPGLVPAVAGTIGHDIREPLARLEIPMLIAWGREDRIVPAADALELSEIVPGARLLVLEGTGHMLQLERPAELNSALRELLATAGS